MPQRGCNRRILPLEQMKCPTAASWGDARASSTIVDVGWSPINSWLIGRLSPRSINSASINLGSSLANSNLMSGPGGPRLPDYQCHCRYFDLAELEMHLPKNLLTWWKTHRSIPIFYGRKKLKFSVEFHLNRTLFFIVQIKEKREEVAYASYSTPS